MVERSEQADRNRLEAVGDELPRRIPEGNGAGRFGRGVVWSDIVALIERDRLASEAAAAEAPEERDSGLEEAA